MPTCITAYCHTQLFPDRHSPNRTCHLLLLLAEATYPCHLQLCASRPHTHPFLPPIPPAVPAATCPLLPHPIYSSCCGCLCTFLLLHPIYHITISLPTWHLSSVPLCFCLPLFCVCTVGWDTFTFVPPYPMPLPHGYHFLFKFPAIHGLHYHHRPATTTCPLPAFTAHTCNAILMDCLSTCLCLPLHATHCYYRYHPPQCHPHATVLCASAMPPACRFSATTYSSTFPHHATCACSYHSCRAITPYLIAFKLPATTFCHLTCLPYLHSTILHTHHPGLGLFPFFLVFLLTP